MRSGSDSLLAARPDPSVRERIRMRLPRAERDAFDAVMEWEDEMLAFCNGLAAKADAAVGLLAECLRDEVAWTGEELTECMERVYEALGRSVSDLD